MRRLWLLASVAALLTACGGGADLPWSDDFDAPGVWQAESDAAAQVEVAGGVMRVYVAVPNQLAWAIAGRDLRDFHLVVEATQVAGPDDNEYGVLARMQDNANFYLFSVSGDGYFLLSRLADGRRELLGADWTPSAAVRQGQATNVLEVVCRGSELVFVVNGEELAHVEDAQFSHGDVGLYAGSFYQGEVEVHFDNLRVTEVPGE